MCKQEVGNVYAHSRPHKLNLSIVNRADHRLAYSMLVLVELMRVAIGWCVV